MCVFTPTLVGKVFIQIWQECFIPCKCVSAWFIMLVFTFEVLLQILHFHSPWLLSKILSNFSFRSRFLLAMPDSSSSSTEIISLLDNTLLRCESVFLGKIS